ncbi:5-deoxy-glucuronate isomerase, partial [Kibdelosporangium lantanae]
DPAGRLPQTWYRGDDELPAPLDYDIIKAGWTYQYHEPAPLYPFGHGLSYTDFAYVPRDAYVTLSTKDGCEVALPMARCGKRLDPKYGPAPEVPVEVRGSGNATRQVTNFGVPGVWDHADKLNACELITPDGNWSSYPPHKHDVATDNEVVNEEIYYFRIAGRDGVTPSREGFGFHRTYTADGEIDEDVTVRDGDVFLIPRGYHGPCVAAP